MSDEKTEQPPAKPTVVLEQVPAWAIELSRNVTLIRGNVELMTGDMVTMKSDIRGLKKWRLEIEDGAGSMPSIPPMTSTGVRALIDGHPSAMDLSLQAAQAAEIIKNQERDRKIEETHALALGAAETLKRQSDYMGMGLRGIQWLWSKDGRTAVAQAAVALVTAYEALKHGGVIK